VVNPRAVYSANALPETRAMACEACGGDGRFSDDRPTPGLYGPCYGPDVICRACDGTGRVEVEVEPITEDDLDEMEPMQ
jgi:hypothetical protein